MLCRELDTLEGAALRISGAVGSNPLEPWSFVGSEGDLLAMLRTLGADLSDRSTKCSLMKTCRRNVRVRPGIGLV